MSGSKSLRTRGQTALRNPVEEPTMSGRVSRVGDPGSEVEKEKLVTPGWDGRAGLHVPTHSTEVCVSVPDPRGPYQSIR